MGRQVGKVREVELFSPRSSAKGLSAGEAEGEGTAEPLARCCRTLGGSRQENVSGTEGAPRCLRAKR